MSAVVLEVSVVLFSTDLLFYFCLGMCVIYELLQFEYEDCYLIQNSSQKVFLVVVFFTQITTRCILLIFRAILIQLQTCC